MDGGSPLWGSHLFHNRGRNKNVFNFISFYILFQGKCQICWTNLISTKFELCLFFFCCKLRWIKKRKASLTLKVMDLYCKISLLQLSLLLYATLWFLVFLSDPGPIIVYACQSLTHSLTDWRPFGIDVTTLLKCRLCTLCRLCRLCRLCKICRICQTKPTRPKRHCL